MTDAPNTPTEAGTRSWLRWVLIGLGVVLGLLLLAVLGGYLWLRSSAGLSYIEGLVEDRELGPIAGIEIDGLDGNPLSALTVERLALRDPQGEWAVIENLAVDYSLLSITERHIDIQSLDAARVRVLRRPELLQTESTGGEPFRVSIEGFEVAELVLEEPVIGQSATLAAEGAFVLEKSGAMDVSLEARRTDGPEETLALDLDRSAAGDLAGTFELASPPGGAVGALLRVPSDQAVTGTGRIDGTLEAGEGTLALSVGGTEAVDATTNWTAERLEASGRVRTAAWPLLDPVRERVGETLELRAGLDRESRAFTATATAPDLDLIATGTLPPESNLPEAADIQLSSNAPQRLLGLPDGFRMGALEAEGRAETGFGGSDLSFDGDVSLRAFASPFFDAATLRAPLTLRRNADGTFDVATDARLRGLITRQALPLELADSAAVRADLRYRPDTSRIVLRDFDFRSGEQSATASGSLTLPSETAPLRLDLRGEADLRTQAIGAVPPGRIRGNYNLQSAPDMAFPAVTAEGSFAPSESFPGPVAELIGDRIGFDVEMQTLEGGAIDIARARVAGDRINAALSGTVADTLDITGEARLTEAVEIASARVAADAQASFTLAGARTDPDLRLDATFPAITAAGQELREVRLRAELADLVSAPSGPVQIEADTDYGPLTASATLDGAEGAYAASGIEVNIAGLSVSGDVDAAGGGLYEGRLVLDLDGTAAESDRYARAILALAPQAGVQGVQLDAEARSVSLLGFDIRTLDAELAGTLDALSGNLDIAGREDALISQPFRLATPLSLAREGTAYTATLSPEGRYEGIRFAARAPVTLRYDQGRIRAELPLSINEGTLEASYAREGTAETLDARMAAIPLQTFPLPAGLGETRGTLSGEASFASGPGQPPTGMAELTLADWRGRLSDPGEGITLALNAALLPDRVNLRLDDGDATRFDIQGQARLPLRPADTLTALRPDPDAPLTARLAANGDAGVIFDLFAPEDSEPEGRLDIEVAALGTLSAPQLTGTASGTDIRFEAPVVGTNIRDGRFAATFTRDSVNVTELSARDRENGRLTGSGAFGFGGGALDGRIEVSADEFRAVDRKDYEGRISGTLAYVTTDQAGRVEGELKLDRAEVKQITAAGPRVVNLAIDREVGEREHQERIRVPRAVIPIELDVALRAPRRLFVRARGIDLEAALDIRIRGTVSEPLITGEAEVLRGGISLAGKELDFTDGSITFNGPIAEATVNLEATAETPTLTANVAVTGTVTEPEIELSSTPERPEDEILSALLFGRSATQLSALEAAQLAGALASLSGSGGGFDLVGGLRDALGFASLDIGLDEDGNALLSGGRYLASDVYLELFSGANGNASGAIISWEVRPNVILRTQVASDNEQAFAVLYSRDF